MLVLLSFFLLFFGEISNIRGFQNGSLKRGGRDSERITLVLYFFYLSFVFPILERGDRREPWVSFSLRENENSINCGLRKTVRDDGKKGLLRAARWKAGAGGCDAWIHRLQCLSMR